MNTRRRLWQASNRDKTSTPSRPRPLPHPPRRLTANRTRISAQESPSIPIETFRASPIRRGTHAPVSTTGLRKSAQMSGLKRALLLLLLLRRRPRHLALPVVFPVQIPLHIRLFEIVARISRPPTLMVIRRAFRTMIRHLRWCPRHVLVAGRASRGRISRRLIAPALSADTVVPAFGIGRRFSIGRR